VQGGPSLISFGGCVGRRAVLQAGIALRIEQGLCGKVLAQGNAISQRPKDGNLFAMVGDSSVTPAGTADLAFGARQVLVWPIDPVDNILSNRSRLNRVMLLRMDQDKFSPETKPRAADGVVACTATCTHASREVTEWVIEEQLLYCPYHESKSEPKDTATVVDGLAPLLLSALALKLVNRKLVAGKTLIAAVAFETQSHIR
jgi:rieske iron-sulfur protein